MGNSLYFNTSPIADFAGLLSVCAPDLKSPCRSTVPLLSLVKDGNLLLEQILAALHLPVNANLHVEFQVMPPRGVGQDSHTDIMALAGDAAVAFEAKWTEPHENRREVMLGWLDLLQRHATRPLNLEEFSDAVYQAVHRAASACAAAARPQMVYLHFAPLPDGQNPNVEEYRRDLTHLHGSLGHPQGFPFHQIEVQITPTPAFREIEYLKKGLPATAEAVATALRGVPLFAFNGYRHHTIDGKGDL